MPRARPDSPPPVEVPHRDPGFLRTVARWMRSGRIRGPYRYAESVAGLIRLPDEPVVTSADGGIFLYVEPSSEPIDRAIYRYGSYEPGTLALMDALIRPGDGVLDVGANIGQMTCYAARLVGESGQVIAFEPSRRTLAILERNLDLNRLSNVEVVGRAAGSAPGEAGLRFRPELGSGASTMVAVTDPDESIEVTTIDHVVDGIARVPVRFMKVDVEGFELQALKGATQMLERDRPIVCMEYSLSQVNSAAPATELLLEKLDGTAFRTVRPKQVASTGGLRAIRSGAEFPQHDNIYIVPKARLADVERMRVR